MVPLIAETWLWWTLVVICVTMRMISRVHIVGSIKHLQVDDYITLVAVAFYTCLIVTINMVAHEDSNLLPPGFDISSLTPSDIKRRQHGSKLVLVVEQSQCVTIWCEKVALLLLYVRLTVASKKQIAIKALLCYAIGSFIVMEILYLGVWCRPFHMYWAVPTETQCSAATNHLITNAVFNISSDVMILCIGLPMFIKTRLPFRKKLAVVGIFSLGTFVIVCSVLNKIYSFTQPFGLDWTFWYVRESSTAILTANAAFVWALARRIFSLRSLGGSTDTRAYVVGYTPQTYTSMQTRAELAKKHSRPTYEEVELDMNLLIPDPESGIHKETESHVTAGSSSSSSTKYGTSASSSPSWAHGWGVRPGSSKDGPSGEGTHNLDFITTPQMPAKAIVKNSHDV